jgi:hypothetical protein
MKFLSKNPSSPIYTQGTVYGHDSLKNRALRNALLKEQYGFCAYTERMVAPTDTVEVEHFNPAIKYHDDYFNYYAVLPWANRSKLRKTYDGSLFFQNIHELQNRISYQDEEYHPSEENDLEARELIRFLGFNEEELWVQRKDHIGRLNVILECLCDSDKDQFYAYLAKHRQELSFPTAIEAEFNIDLTDILQNP